MGVHVLLVEDSALVVDALRLLLEETGHRVSAAFTVRQAIDTAHAEQPDVILLDLTLGREDGLDVLDELTRTGRMPPVAVALTGHDSPETRERCLEAGCLDVLTKPISALELPRRIRAWLADSGASDGSSAEGATSDPAA
jgi:DNA-binding response OmpR family regulator